MAILDTIKKVRLHINTATGYIKYKFFADDIVTNKGTTVEDELNTINTNLTDMNDIIAKKADTYILGIDVPAQPTGEFINSKPVYAKMVNFGALPNATTKSVGTGISNADYFWIDLSNSFAFSGGGCYPISYVDSGNVKNSVACRLTGGGATIAIQTGTNWSTYAGLITVKFTKK